MSNPTGKGGFGERKNHINRKGRPKSFDALRELARQVAHEPVKTKDGQPVVVDGRGVTTAEMILRMWAGSPDFRKQQGFMEIAFGKVPNAVDITSAGQAIVFHVGSTIDLGEDL